MSFIPYQGLGKTLEMITLILEHPRKYTNASGDGNVDGSAAGPAQPEAAMLSTLVDVPVTSAETHVVDLGCLCGGQESGRVVECSKCNVKQHAECVKYNGSPDTFRCSQCIVTGQRLKSSATLIISPDLIKNQWRDEIARHVAQGALSVLCYDGIKAGDYQRPETLASYDIVITSYRVLRTEVHYDVADDTSRRSSRHRKRYGSPASPLTAIEWWRVCLDEAQMVEGSTSNAAAMVCTQLCGFLVSRNCC